MTAASRDRSAEHAWNGTRLKRPAGARTTTARALSEAEVLRGALTLAGRATGAADLRELLDATGLDLDVLRRLRGGDGRE